MCTLAHRHGLGNVVWLSYNCGSLGKPKTAKPSLIYSASTLVALSVNGARAFHALIVGATPMHIDLWLRAQLEQHTETLGCSYVNPPIGSYEEHVSGCEPSVGLRKSGFREKWSRQGARLAAGKWLVRFRFRRTDPIRCVTEVGQATAPKTEDARADVIKMHGKKNITTLSIGLMSFRPLLKTQTRPCTLCW